METFYRFELAFDDELQNVGLLHGLDGTGLRDEITQALYAPFDKDLPIYKLDKHITWWFTEAGLHKFAHAVDCIINAIADHGWQVYGSVMENDRKQALIHDIYQACFLSGQTNHSPFQKMTSAIDVCKIDRIGG